MNKPGAMATPTPSQSGSQPISPGLSDPLGPVEVSIPADPRLARVVRLAASSIAAQIGFDVDLIDDVKLVVSEIILALIEHGDGGSITLALTSGEAELEVLGSTAGQRFDASDPHLLLSLQVLGGVASHHSVSFVDGQIRLSAAVRDIVV